MARTRRRVQIEAGQQRVNDAQQQQRDGGRDGGQDRALRLDHRGPLRPVARQAVRDARQRDQEQDRRHLQVRRAGVVARVLLAAAAGRAVHAASDAEGQRGEHDPVH